MCEKILEEKIRKEFEQIEKIAINKYPTLDGCIMDGILNPKDYWNPKNKYKICFILKEPYDDWDNRLNMPKGGGWSFINLMENLFKDYQSGAVGPTWLNVASIAYSINTGTSFTTDHPFHEIMQGLSSVSWINLSKIPWRSSSKMDNEYKNRAEMWIEMRKLQLELAKPDIVFYGSTWDYDELNPFSPREKWNDNEVVHNFLDFKNYRIDIVDCKGKIAVNGYHPAYNDECSKWETESLLDYLQNKNRIKPSFL